MIMEKTFRKQTQAGVFERALLLADKNRVFGVTMMLSTRRCRHHFWNIPLTAGIVYMIMIITISTLHRDQDTSRPSVRSDPEPEDDPLLPALALQKPPKPGGPPDGRWASEIEDVSLMTTDKEKVGKILRARREEVRDVCQRVLSPEELSQPPNSKEFLISEKYKVVWCNVFKAASSTWLFNFMLMARVNKEEMERSKTSPVEFARTKAYPRPSVEDLTAVLKTGNYTSFLIVREPFQRLLSAYRDKIESSVQSYYRPLRCRIQRDFGQAYSPQIRSRDCKPSFPAFVDYVIDERAKGNSPNEHWAPYYTFCTPCQVHFEYVLHFESLSEEEAFFVGQIPGLSDVVKPRKLHASHTDYVSVTRDYFSQVKSENLRKLFEIYKKDFELFGYDASIYFQYAKD